MLARLARATKAQVVKEGASRILLTKPHPRVVNITLKTRFTRKVVPRRRQFLVKNEVEALASNGSAGMAGSPPVPNLAPLPNNLGGA